MQAANRDFGLIELFLDMLASERGAARNTIDAYRRDLSSYFGWLSAKGCSPLSADTETIRAYLAALADQGLAASSAARRLWPCGNSTGFCFRNAAAPTIPPQSSRDRGAAGPCRKC